MSDLKQFAKDNHVPIIQDGGLDFLLKTIKKINAKDILELGSAIGYSAISMARLSDDIHIDTIERDQKMYEEAFKNVKDAALNDQITLNFMDIRDYVPSKKYDLIFVDAAKGQYYNYLNQFIDYLKEDGVMFFDNMVFHGLTKDPDAIKNRNTRSLVKKINKFKELVKEDSRFDIILYEDIGDGILILTRRK
ncbi:MAG: O-methyltransferase [Erysipelotrichaceae bacterium]|nr:O-methyltransferase [Erysipelotrichaceae bacterium]